MMKANNKEKKRVNILDLIFFILIIVVVFFAIGSLTGVFSKKEQVAEDSVNYSYEVKKVDPEILNYAKEGVVIYNEKSKQVMGEIVAVHEDTAKVLLENHKEKKVQYAEIPDKIDLVLEIKANAEFKYPDITIGKEALKVGKSMACIVGNAYVDGTITGIEYDQPLLEQEENKDDNR